MLLKMGGAMAPVNTKVVDQVGGNNVAGTHAHISCEPELLHASIDNLFARTTILPSLQVLLRSMPRRSVTGDTTQLENSITLTPGNVNHEVTPLQHVWEPIGAEVLCHPLGFVPQSFFPNTSGGDAA